MKLKFFSSGRIELGFALIGKPGAIRFKQSLAVSMKFMKGEKWLIGIDEEEKKPTAIYIFRVSEDHPNGFKMIYQNKSWSIAGKTVIKELKLAPPIKCKIEPYKDNEHEGLKLILP